MVGIAENRIKIQPLIHVRVPKDLAKEQYRTNDKKNRKKQKKHRTK